MFLSWSSFHKIQWLHFSASNEWRLWFRCIFLVKWTIYFCRVYIFGVKIIRISSRRIEFNVLTSRTMNYNKTRCHAINSTCDESMYQSSICICLVLFLLFVNLTTVYAIVDCCIQKTSCDQTDCTKDRVFIILLKFSFHFFWISILRISILCTRIRHK